MASCIEVYLADEVVKMRHSEKKRFEFQSRLHASSPGGSAPTQAIVGGFVRAYKFNYERDQPIAQGRMYIKFDSRDEEYNATMLILGGEAVDGEMAARIVKNTMKISDECDAVVEAYFSTFCEKINRWIVVYEEFDQWLTGGMNNQISNFLAEKDNLSQFWREKMRSFVRALKLARDRKVVHGSLHRQSSYVISSDTIKIINVAQYHQEDKTEVNDVYDLAGFISSHPFLAATNSPSWISLCVLLNSEMMHENDWHNLILGHPMLLEQSERAVVYEELEVFIWNNPRGEILEFANAMYVKIPSHRLRDLSSFCPPPTHSSYVVLSQLFTNTTAHSIIYVAIIQFARNLMHHANDYTKLIRQTWDEVKQVQVIEELFSVGFMGMAYSLSKITSREINNLLNSPEAAAYRPTFFT